MRACGKQEVLLEHAEKGSVATLRGEIDIYTLPEFERHLIDALAEGRGYFAVDLNGLGFMDSQGIHLLARVKDMAREIDRPFYVVCAGGACRKVLDAVGADGIFNLQAGRDALEDLDDAERMRPSG